MSETLCMDMGGGVGLAVGHSVLTQSQAHHKGAQDCSTEPHLMTHA
jgi:hypothetical protein